MLYLFTASKDSAIKNLEATIEKHILFLHV